MKRIKKMLTISCAAVMAISAISINAFAEDVVATIRQNNEETIEVFETDLMNGTFSIPCGNMTITLEEKDNTAIVSDNLKRQLRGTSYFVLGATPSSSVTKVTGTEALTFSVNQNETKTTATYYTPGASKTSLRYDFKVNDDSKGNKITATVYALDNNNNPMSIAIADTSTHTVRITGMTTGDRTYATLTNYTSKTAAGTCKITN